MERTWERGSNWKTIPKPKKKPLHPLKRRSLIGKLLPLFSEYPFTVKKGSIANVYSKRYSKSISWKQHGFTNLTTFYNETDVFDDLDDGFVKVSREKLLDYLLKPLIGAEDLESSFKTLNSFSHQILLNFYNASSLDALMKEVTQTQTVSFVPPDSSVTITPSGSSGLPTPSAWPAAPIFSPTHTTVPSTTSATNTPSANLGSPVPFTGPAPPLFLPTDSTILPTTSATNTPSRSFGSSIPSTGPAPLVPLTDSTSPSTATFPNNGIHPKDEGYLPPLPGHPRLDLPTLHGTTTLKLPSRPVAEPGEQRSEVVEKIELYMKELMVFCSKQGKHLPVSILTTELDTVIHTMPKGLQVSRRDIKSWDDFDRLYKRLDFLIRNVCWQCPFTSLYDLQRTIVEFEKVPSFDDLGMGPILKHPLIKEFFKVPDGLTSVPEVTTYDILITLSDYFQKKKGIRRGNLDDFMCFFAEKFNVASPEFLCVRICDFRLAKSGEEDLRRSQIAMRKSTKEHSKNEIYKVVNSSVKSLQNSLQKMSQNKFDLIKKSPAEIVKGVFNLLREHFPSITHPRLLAFMDTVLADYRLRNLFTIAVYQSAYGAQQCVQEHAQNKYCPIQRSELVRIIADLLKCEQFPIDLSSLADIEESLLQRYSVNTFNSFSHGPFLRFVVEDKELVKCIGGRHIGSSGGNYSGSFQRSCVLGFIRQVEDTSDTEIVSSALKDQFSVQNVEDLSCGGIERLISDAEAQRGTTHNSSSTPFVAYTVPLLRNGQSRKVPNKPHGSSYGLLGPQSSENAYARLSKAPLLANLSEWMQWDLIYAPSLGPLGDFLTKQHQSRCETPIHALYDSTGRFLKIDPDSKRKDFENAVDEFDPICAAGHLVSMAVNEASVHLMPIQLLANCVTTKLEQIDVSDKDGLVSEAFVFHCLQQIPLELCETLGKQVFLDPLRKVKSVESVNSLLQLCETPSQRCFFQALGLKLGINEWINDFKEMRTSGNKLTTRIQSLQPYCVEERFPDVTEGIKPSSVSFVLFSQSELDTSNETQDLIQPSYDNEGISSEKAETIVDKIRREEFGLHLQLTEEQLKISNKQKEREGRSLQRLSQELYSKDTHFVLELIQNADDNTYTLEASVPPTVKFVLHKDCVTVLNNEVGFSEKNIRAICDVGKSTKDPLQSGYIGEKGIGFKSVFRITSTPEIHSNNFHIRFDTTSGPIGYILPEWINSSFIDDKISPSELSKWTTRIVLPMKPERSSRSLVKKFKDIQPSLLLFLNRLRSIVIHDMESGDVKTMVRQDMGEGVTVITHNKGVDRWLVARKELKDANKYKSGVHTTELAIAFPLPEDFDSLPNARDLQSQQVFAYLPLRSYGFRFIIQGDFDLPSSREDVNEDSSWNQWLREMIPSLFVEALENIKALSQLNIVQAISLFVQFIPLDGEVHNFFKPVAGQILRLLRTSEWLPTDCASATNAAFNEGIDFGQIIELMMTDGESQIGLPYETHSVALKQPSQLVMPQDLICKYIPQSVLAASLNLYYLHSLLVSRISSDLCSHLGITTMTLDNLIDIAKSVLDSYHSDDQSNSSIDIDIEDDDSEGVPLSPFNHLVSWIACWLACVYTVLEETRDISSSSLLKLKKLHIIPLMDESLVALDSVIVFFPPSSNKSDDGIKKYEKLYKQLKVIHNDFLVSGDQVVRGKVYQMLSAKLGVKELSPLDIVNHHIIPGFSPTMKVDENIAFLRFIKENLDQCSERLKSQIMEKLKECVYFVTANNELKSPREQCIRFSTQYKDQWDLPTLFPGVSWTLVSSKYLERNSNRWSWRNFFQTLGVKSGKLLLVERINHAITSQNKQTSLWDVFDWRRSRDGSYTVRDYYSREFDDIVAAISSVKTLSQKYDQLLALSRLIDSCWDSEYSKCFKAVYYDESTDVRLGEVISSFGKSIREKAWLPAMNLDKNPHELTPMMKGTDLYEHTEQITDLLDDHMPYLCFKFKSHDLLEKIRVKRVINEATLLAHLQFWSATQSTFITSINHMKHVYSYLARNKEFLNNEKFRFGHEKLIYCPTQFCPPHEKGKGEFVTVHNCCWEDRTTVLFTMLFEGKFPPPRLPRILSFFYSSANEGAKSEMEHTFIQLGVEKVMKLSSLIDLLEFISLNVPRPTPTLTEKFRWIAKAVVESIYERADQGFVMNEDKRTFFKTNVQDKEVFPTTNKKWSSLTGLFVDDDAEIAKLFSVSDKVHFLNWTPNQTDSHTTQPGSTPLQKFIEICNIPLLSKNCHKSIVPRDVQPFDELQRLFHNIVLLIQLYCLSLEQQPDKRTHEYQCAMFDTLQKLKFFSTVELSCTYSVGDYSSPAVPLKRCQLQFDDSSVIVYGVVDMEDRYEKMSLVEVLQELFKFEKEDTRSFKFLASLIFNEPSSESDKMAVIKTFNLEGYLIDVCNFPLWRVELPDLYFNLEEEEEMMAANDEGNKAALQQIVMGDQQQGIQLGKRPLEEPEEWRQSQRSSKDPSTWNYQQSHDVSQSPSIQPQGHSGYVPSANTSLFKFRNRFNGKPEFKIGHLMQSIPIDLSRIPQQHFIPQDTDRVRASGRWGEWFAYHVLRGCSTLPGNEHVNIVSVKWVNADSETGLPYDIEVCTDDSNMWYIEVKSTTSSDKGLVSFSVKELKFAQAKSSKYGLVRVCCSLSLVNARVQWLQDLYKILESNQGIKVYLKF